MSVAAGILPRGLVDLSVLIDKIVKRKGKTRGSVFEVEFGSTKTVELKLDED